MGSGFLASGFVLAVLIGDLGGCLLMAMGAGVLLGVGWKCLLPAA